MAVTKDDFEKIWASSSPLTPYSFTDSNYKEGWNFVGSTPPSRQMWDYQQNLNDLKTQYLFDNTAKAFNWQADTSYTVGNQVKTPSLPPECVLVCTTAGTSNDTEPDYTGLNIGDTVQDGTCEWLISSYLPITGGTMTGAIVGNPLTLSADDGNDSADLVLNSSGSATWNGKEVERVNASGADYIRYESGLQIVWGNATSVTSSGKAITYPVAFKDTNYKIFTGASGYLVSADGTGYSGRTNTGCNLTCGYSGGASVDYLAVGYWK